MSQPATAVETESKKVGSVSLRKKRNAFGEYVVRAYDEDGKRYPPADYYTDDWDDAVSTANLMAPIAD
jgi:hypothetical protein